MKTVVTAGKQGGKDEKTMELQLLHDVQASQSVEGWIREKVEGLDDRKRLEAIVQDCFMPVRSHSLRTNTPASYDRIAII